MFNNNFDKLKENIIEDTSILKDISKKIDKLDNDSQDSTIELFDSTWHLSILHYAIDNNKPTIIHKLVEKNNTNPDFVNENLKSYRDINRYKLLEAFFKKNILS